VLLAAPRAAMAQCHSGPECLLRLGVGQLDPKIAAIVGGAAAVAIAAGATAAAAREANRKEMPDGVVEELDEQGRRRLVLTLIPTPIPVTPGGPGGGDETRQVPWQLRLNDTATNVALVVGGAAILTSIIVGILKK
jgi:hypothetical protein